MKDAAGKLFLLNGLIDRCVDLPDDVRSESGQQNGEKNGMHAGRV
jgi:hypothetical protein